MATRPAKSDAEKRGHDRPSSEHDDRLRGRAAVWQDPDPRWLAPVTAWYVALARSGQSVYYQQSDAAQAFVLAELLDYGLRHKDGPFVRMWLTGSRELLTTESSRRGAHVRLEPTEHTDDQVVEAADDLMNVIKVAFREVPA